MNTMIRLRRLFSLSFYPIHPKNPGSDWLMAMFHQFFINDVGACFNTQNVIAIA